MGWLYFSLGEQLGERDQNHANIRTLSASIEHKYNVERPYRTKYIINDSEVITQLNVFITF